MQIQRGALIRVCWSVGLVATAISPAHGAIKTFLNPDHSLCCGPRGGIMTVDGLPARERPAFAAHALPLAEVGTAAVVDAAASDVMPVSTSSAPASVQGSASDAPASATTATPAGSGNAAVATTPAVAPPEQVNGYLKLGFDRLASFAFNPAPYDPAKPNEPPPSSADQIPQTVRDYTGKKALITGFMLPVKTEKGLVTEFLLMRDAMMCCYGVVPNINEWVVVRMTNGGVQSTQDVPLNVFGKLHVKELYENGYLSGIYLLEGEKMAIAK